VIQKAGAELKTKPSREVVQHRYSLLLGFNFFLSSTTILTEKQQSQRVEELRHVFQQKILKVINWQGVTEPKLNTLYIKKATTVIQVTFYVNNSKRGFQEPAFSCI
jgi:hypothetical protein